MRVKGNRPGQIATSEGVKKICPVPVTKWTGTMDDEGGAPAEAAGSAAAADDCPPPLAIASSTSSGGGASGPASGKTGGKNKAMMDRLSNEDRQMSPLQIAFARGHDEIVRLLLSRGARW